ncbi:cytochrome P450 3A2-like isoform X2 [Stegodyphus dumicola]|uniref:cytochrome P450 3A2-like isoform X2 n=1 Tax=Stegodyphus dumicola TaxID=202533 RepID=UPI0015AD49F5|nr:cytochrome P450 3A2-like isoform X2 [Stegodyphus dumicola]
MRITSAFEFRTPFLMVAEPELVKDILVKDFQIFSNKRDFTTNDPTMDNMAFMLNGEDWKRVRTIITPAFTSKKMRIMAHIINDCAKTLVQTLEKHAENKEPVNCKKLFGTFTMDVIACSAFATKIDCHNDPNNIFVKHARKIFEEFFALRMLIILLFFPNWLRKNLGFKIVPSAEFFRNVTLQVIKERRQKGHRHNDFLQLLMDAADEVTQEPEESENAGFKSVEKNDDEIDQFGSVTSKGISTSQKYTKLSQDELIAQCVMFFFVGYETAASTLSYIAYSLALNPECQEKLIQEIDDAFQKHGQVDHDVVRDLKYLDYVVSETLRMYPILTLTDRTAAAEYKLGNTGITIEKSSRVIFPIYAMHHDPEFFPDPEKFNPERWIRDASGKLSHPQYAYLPFGAGPRNCLGMRFALMEIKLCMANILRNFRFKKAKTTEEPLKFIPGNAFLSVKELPLMVEKRTELNTPAEN